MNPSVNITFEGPNCLRNISENKREGMIDIVFECNGEEQILSFEPELFKLIAEKMNKYLEGDVKITDDGKHVDNVLYSGGRIIPNMFIFLDHDEMSISLDWDTPEEDNPMLIIQGKRGGRFELGVNMEQAKAIAERCLKILETRKALKDVLKKQIIRVKEAKV